MNRQETIEEVMKNQFEFLSVYGFRILYFEYYDHSFGDWKMTFQSSACFIEAYSDRGDVNVIFKPIDTTENKRFGISLLVYFVTDKKIFIGEYEGELRNQYAQIERLAIILKKYIDLILPITGKEFSKHYDLLDKFGEIVFKLHMKNSKGTYH